MSNPNSVVGQAFRFCVRCLIHFFMRCTRWVAAPIISFLSTARTSGRGRAPTPRPTLRRLATVFSDTITDPVIEAGVLKILASIKIKTEGSTQEIFEDFLRQLDELQAQAHESDLEELLIWEATMDYLAERFGKRRNILEMAQRAPAVAA